jgi:phosphocarrier protein HPr
MVEKSYTLNNKTGLHARPCALLSKELRDFKASVTAVKGTAEADMKQAMKVIKLGIESGDTFTIRAEGEDAEAAVDKAVSFLDSLKD